MNQKEIKPDERICYTIADAIYCIQIGYEYILSTKDTTNTPCILLRRKKETTQTPI